MPILFIDVLRAIWALRCDRGFLSLAGLLAIAVLGGSVFYWQVEGLRPLNAAYLTVLTLTTVGYGDLTPETAAGKVFTAVFVLVGVGIVLAVLSSIATQIRRPSVLRRPLTRLAARDEARGQLIGTSARRVDEVAIGSGPGAIGEYDLLVIGSGDASHRTAVEAAQAGLRVVIVEAEHRRPNSAGGSNGVSRDREPQDLRPWSA